MLGEVLVSAAGAGGEEAPPPNSAGIDEDRRSFKAIAAMAWPMVSSLAAVVSKEGADVTAVSSGIDCWVSEGVDEFMGNTR